MTVLGAVGAHPQPTGHNDFAAAFVVPCDGRRETTRKLGAICLPDHFAGVLVDGEQERIDIVILVQNHEITHQDGRAARAVIVLEGPQRQLPQQLAAVVVANQPADPKKLTTRSLSAAGVAIAWLPMWWISSSRRFSASRSQRGLPVLRSSEIVTRCLSRSAVKKMRSSTTVGDECPGGSLVDQMRLALGPISCGSGRSTLGRPDALGPRNCGHESAPREAGPPQGPHKKRRSRTKPQRIGGDFQSLTCHSGGDFLSFWMPFADIAQIEGPQPGEAFQALEPRIADRIHLDEFATFIELPPEPVLGVLRSGGMVDAGTSKRMPKSARPCSAQITSRSSPEVRQAKPMAGIVHSAYWRPFAVGLVGHRLLPEVSKALFGDRIPAAMQLQRASSGCPAVPSTHVSVAESILAGSLSLRICNAILFGGERWDGHLQG